MKQFPILIINRLRRLCNESLDSSLWACCCPACLISEASWSEHKSRLEIPHRFLNGCDFKITAFAGTRQTFCKGGRHYLSTVVSWRGGSVKINSEWGRGRKRERATKERVVCGTTCSQSVLVDLSEGHLDVQQRSKINTETVEWVSHRVSHFQFFLYVLNSFRFG